LACSTDSIRRPWAVIILCQGDAGDVQEDLHGREWRLLLEDPDIAEHLERDDV
jgi:hypothetical protein